LHACSINSFAKTLPLCHKYNSWGGDEAQGVVLMSFPNSYFQDPATPIMEGIVDFHNYVMFYVVVILLFVVYAFASILIDFFYKYNYFSFEKTSLSHRSHLFGTKHVAHASLLELIWTIIPSVVLAFIAVPSFLLLYSMDEVIDPALTLKAVGHQWYWSYEYSDYAQMDINFDSYMVPTAELT